MARVLIETQPWGVIQDISGNALIGQSVHIANTDGTAATTWSAQTGGSSTTTDQTTGSNGAIPQYLEEGEYDVTVAGITKRVQAVHGANVGYAPSAPLATRVVPSSRITTYQSGHGFTQGTGSGTNSDDATDYTLGSQSRKFVTAGDTTFARDTKSGLTIDFTGKFARVLLKMDKVLATQITGGQLYLATSTGFTDYYKVELFDLLSGPARNTYWLPDDWAYITMGFSEFTITGAPTLSGITVARLAFQDASTVVTLHVQAIDLMPAPSVGVVSIMFDDGWASNWTKAQPRTSLYGFPATTYTIADRIVNNDALAVTLPQLKSLQNDHGWEIASHAYSQAMHDARYVNYTDTQVADDFARLKGWLRTNGLGRGDQFAWPNGEFDAAKLAVARQYFTSARTIRGQSHETYPPADRMRLRYITGIAKSSATMNAEVDKCIAQKSWLTLSFHDIADSIGGAQAGIQTTTANYNATIDYIATKVAAGTLKVKTVGDVLATGVA